MTERTPTGDAFLTPSQRQLLTAALSADMEAVARAWRAWRDAADLDTLPGGQVPLLPVLHANLARFGLAEEADPRLKGIHRRAWYANQLALDAAKRWLQRLETGGVPVMLADAPALALTAYGDRFRSLDALALIVPPEHTATAARVLLEEGGERPFPATASVDPDSLWVQYETWRMSTGQRLELHRHAAPFWPSAALDAAAWGRAQSIALGKRSVLALSAADQLVRSSVAAVGSGSVSLMALADMAMLLGVPGGVDWEVVLQVAETGRANRALLAALECLEGALDLAAPAEVMTRLRAGQRARYAVLAAAPNRLRAARGLYAQYRRVLAARGIEPGWGLFLDFLQYRWGLRRRSEIFQHAVARWFR